MKLSKKLTPVALAVSMAAGVVAVPTAANAELSYNAAVSNMYLWRGLDVSSGGAVVSGGVDYAHDSGAYASLWASTGNSLGSAAADPTLTPGYEFDVILGYSGEVSGFGYDLSYWRIAYPQASSTYGEEAILGLSYMGVEFSYVDNLDNDYKYYTLGYSMDKYSIMYGASEDDAGAEYSHVDLGYAATDALSFTISMPSDDTAGISEQTLIAVTYSLPL